MSLSKYVSKKTGSSAQTDTIGLDSTYDGICGLWLLRAAAAGIGNAAQLFSESCRRITGLPILPKAETDEEDDIDADAERAVRRRADALVRKHLTTRERNGTVRSGVLITNIAVLGERLGLSPAEREILAFAVLLNTCTALKKYLAAANINNCTKETYVQVLSTVLGFPRAAVKQAFGERSILVNTGLITLHKELLDFEDKLDSHCGLADILLDAYTTPDELFGRFHRVAPAPALTPADYPHIREDFELLCTCLARSIAARETGVNVLLYGNTGTGKTEFARVLAAALGARLIEVACEDDVGDPITGKSRLSSYQLCQRFLEQADNTLVLFDEIEDVLQPGNPFAIIFGDGKGVEAGKAWINRILETNPLPTLWLSNEVEQIDPAVRRRFDYSIEFRPPPKAVRAAISHKYLSGLGVSEETLAEVAGHEALTAAQMEKAARVLRLTAPESESDRNALLRRVLRRSMSLLGQPRRRAAGCDTGYRLDCLNMSADPQSLITGLRRSAAGTLCFYGPPGTGKTALARHIADELHLPLQTKRASDILSCWVGMSERNIAAMFEEASDNPAVLVLDEADSFLEDRRNAAHSWEVTQVNELLTQMEAFDGIFICTTNLMARLDAASLRRFTWKVRFDYLTREQRWALFVQELERLGGTLPADAEAVRRCLQRLTTLTPGDFATAVRQARMIGEEPTAGRLLQALEEECRAKGEPTAPIGFVQ